MVEYRFFPDEELACKCGECDSGAHSMHPDFMHKLEAIREEMGVPLIVSSAYRCPEHNNKVSSTGRVGPHTTGRAVDIAIRGADALKLVALAYQYGMTGVGVKQTGSGRFIHLDDLGSDYPRPTIWSY